MDQQPKEKLPSIEDWTKSLKAYPFAQETINKLIANYLVRAGCKEAVETFIQESNVNPTISLCSLDVRVQIVESIVKGDALEAVRLLEQFFPGLQEADPLLKFQLLQLHLIELIRTGCIEGALFFVQKLALEITEYSLEVSNEIERTLMLLIYDDPLASPFGALLEQSHRDKVARAFNEAILQLTNQGLPSLELDHLVRMVLWCQDELSKGRVWCIKMKNFPTTTLELEEKEL